MLAIAIIEDQDIIRHTYATYLRAQPEFRVGIVAASVEEFLAHLAGGAEAPRVVLSDIGLPGGLSGIQGIQRIKEAAPRADVLLISVFDDAARVFQALCAGAVGYLVKNTPLSMLKEHLLQVAAGGSPMSPSIARHVVAHFQPQLTAEEVLTGRELQLVQGIEDGLSYTHHEMSCENGVETHTCVSSLNGLQWVRQVVLFNDETQVCVSTPALFSQTNS